MCTWHFQVGRNPGKGMGRWVGRRVADWVGRWADGWVAGRGKRVVGWAEGVHV